MKLFSQDREEYNVLASERTRYIISQLNNKGIINLKDVARELNISEATVRRDFEKLENEGKLTRVTGGAKLNDDPGKHSNTAELTMRAKKFLNYDAKLRTARAASECIQDGECIFVDGGTSTSVIAKFVEKRQITIVTHSELFVQSTNNPTAKIFLVGGEYLPHYGMNVGDLTKQMLSHFHFDRAFISCSSVDLNEGFAYTNELDTLAIKTFAIENCDKAYLLIDSSKLNKKGFCKLDSLSNFENIYCNECPALNNPPSNFKIV